MPCSVEVGVRGVLCAVRVGFRVCQFHFKDFLPSEVHSTLCCMSCVLVLLVIKKTFVQIWVPKSALGLMDGSCCQFLFTLLSMDIAVSDLYQFVYVGQEFFGEVRGRKQFLVLIFV